MKIEYRTDRDSALRSVNVPIGENMEELKKQFTDSDIYSHCVANMTVKIQGKCRAHQMRVEHGKESKLPKDWITFLKPRHVKTDAEKLADLGMTKEQLEKLIANME